MRNVKKNSALAIVATTIILANCTSSDIEDLPPISELSSSSAGSLGAISSPSAKSSSSITSSSDDIISCLVGANCVELPQSACATIGGTHIPYCPAASSSSNDIALPEISSSSIPNALCLVGTSCLELPQNICASVGTQVPSCPVSSSSNSANLQGTMQFDGDEIIDQRDGKRYKYEAAPNGQVWMSENLNFSSNNTLGWCYVTNGTELGTQGADGAGCARPYGRVYTQETAMTVCPTGWHLPTPDELDDTNIYDDLYSLPGMSSDFYVSAGNFNENPKWPLGWRDRGSIGFYWTNQSSVFRMMYSGGYVGTSENPASPTNDYFSVRCIMNED